MGQRSRTGGGVAGKYVMVMQPDDPISVSFCAVVLLLDPDRAKASRFYVKQVRSLRDQME
jgi:hypothetical protein